MTPNTIIRFYACLFKFSTFPYSSKVFKWNDVIRFLPSSASTHPDSRNGWRERKASFPISFDRNLQCLFHAKMSFSGFYLIFIQLQLLALTTNSVDETARFRSF